MQLLQTTDFQIHDKFQKSYSVEYSKYITFYIKERGAVIYTTDYQHLCRRRFYKVFPYTSRDTKNTYKLVIYDKWIRKGVKIELSDYGRSNNVQWFLVDGKRMGFNHNPTRLLEDLLLSRKRIYVRLERVKV